MHEQTRQNLDILQALTTAVDWNKAVEAVDWERVFQIQGEFAARQPGTLGPAHAALSRGHPGGDDGDGIGHSAAGEEGGLAPPPTQ